MNNLPQIFSNPNFGEIRTIEIEGKPYFVGIDIAKALGYKDPNSAISRHCKGSVKHPVPTNSGIQEMNIIPEGDIYRLAARSELPSAIEFESWIFDEVLPQIRKTGSYAAPSCIEDLIIMQAQAMKDLRKEVSETKLQVAENAQQVQAIKEALLPNDKEWRKQINEKLNQVAKVCDADYQGIRELSYQLLEGRAGCNLSRRVANLKTRLREGGATKTVINNACKLDAIESDKKLKEIYSSIVRELVVKYLA